MNTILNDWNKFKNKVIPVNSPIEQFTEMKKAFYAGAFIMFQKIVELSDNEDIQSSFNTMDAIMSEIDEYFSQLSGETE